MNGGLSQHRLKQSSVWHRTKLVLSLLLVVGLFGVVVSNAASQLLIDFLVSGVIRGTNIVVSPAYVLAGVGTVLGLVVFWVLASWAPRLLLAVFTKQRSVVGLPVPASDETQAVPPEAAATLPVTMLHTIREARQRVAMPEPVWHLDQAVNRHRPEWVPAAVVKPRLHSDKAGRQAFSPGEKKVGLGLKSGSLTFVTDLVFAGYYIGRGLLVVGRYLKYGLQLLTRAFRYGLLSLLQTVLVVATLSYDGMLWALIGILQVSIWVRFGLEWAGRRGWRSSVRVWTWFEPYAFLFNDWLEIKCQQVFRWVLKRVHENEALVVFLDISRDASKSLPALRFRKPRALRLK